MKLVARYHRRGRSEKGWNSGLAIGGGGTRWTGWDRLRKRGWLPLSSTLRRGETRCVPPLFLPFHARSIPLSLWLSDSLSLFLLSSASLILEFRHSAPLIMQALFSNPPDERRNLTGSPCPFPSERKIPFFCVLHSLSRVYFFVLFFFAIEIFTATQIKDRKRELKFRSTRIFRCA